MFATVRSRAALNSTNKIICDKNMTLLLPDELLESLLCSFCYKFLSVRPVEVYPNKQIRCGRCTGNFEDVGVVSLFGIIGEHSLFKCINRFDGCHKLLKYSQVRDHERQCRSKSYQCPLCPSFTDVPTYLMNEHFKREHPSALLKRPTFNIDSTDWSGSTSIFLHRKGNSLFFISYKVDVVEEYLLLKIFFLGRIEKGGEIKHTFFIRNSCESGIIRSVEGVCIPHDFGDYEGLRIDVQGLQYSQMINVEFEVDIDTHEKLQEMPSSTDSKSTNTDLTVPLAPMIRKVDKCTNTNLIYSEVLNAYESFSIWVDNHPLLFCSAIAFMCFIMFNFQQNEENCLKDLKHERQLNSECMSALKRQPKESCFLF